MKNRLYCIAVKNEKQIDAEILAAVDYLILCPEEYTEKSVLDFMSIVNCNLYLNLPVIAMSRDVKVLRGILGNDRIRERLAGVAANNVYALKLAREYGLDVFKGPWMNTLNDNFCGYENIILSPELSEKEYRLFGDWDKKNYFLCVYGYLPLMTLAHCPYKVNGIACGKCDKAPLQYKDELNNVMNIRRTRLSSCYFELLNSVPLNLLKYKNKVKPHYFFDMREENARDISKILGLFKEPGNKDPEGKYTAGLYFKELK